MSKSKTILLSLCFVIAFLFCGQGNSIVLNADSLTPNCKASVLIDCGTGSVLYESNQNKALPIASVTKLMTILLTLEEINKGNLSTEDVVNVSSNAAGMGGSQVFLDANTEHSVSNLLKAVIVASANDASVALAEHISGSEQEFVSKMNNRANELGLVNTNFVNCTGLPTSNHYSCAIDVANIMREVVKNPLYFQYSGIWMEEYPHPSGRVTEMANTNKLIRNYNGCDAGKTGSTNEAGFCLCATAQRNNMRLISVVLGADSSANRFADASAQFDWGFSNYESTQLVNSLENLANQIDLQKASENQINVKAEEDYWALCKKGDSKQYEVNYEFPESVKAPIFKGDVVGKIIVTKDGIVEKEINIVANEDIEQLSLFGTFKKIVNLWKL